MIKYFVASKAMVFMHGEAWARPGEASKPEFLHMARPKRGRARPTISLELDFDLESEAGRGLGNYRTFTSCVVLRKPNSSYIKTY